MGLRLFLIAACISGVFAQDYRAKVQGIVTRFDRRDCAGSQSDAPEQRHRNRDRT